MRVSRLFALASLALFGLSQASLAAGAHGVSPRIVLGPQALSADTGTQYQLRKCQVGLSVGSCYDPYQMRHAYGVDGLISAGYDGTGMTIVIIDAFQNPNLVSQIAYYNMYYGLPPTSLTQVAPDGLTAFVPGDPNMTGWAEEISLDVEWAHAIAPGANIVLVLAKSNQDADIQSALDYAVNQNLGDVISMSFGENENCVNPAIMAAQHDAFVRATQSGITLFASSGDQGASQQTCDGTSWVRVASSPAVDPLVTAVGGTELHAADFCLPQLGCDPNSNPAPGTWLGEIAWNEGPPFGDFQDFFGSSIATGGGFSDIFDAPPWQKAKVKGSGRGVPDVAYNAAVLHGVLTYLDIPGIPRNFYRFGGTSSGAPQMSAITAIADQRAGKRLGFLNSALYQIGRVKKAYPASLHDVTSGTNSVVEFDASNNPVTVAGFNAGSGWDATTGSGTPIDQGLVDNLIRYVSPGDGTAAVASTKPKAKGPPNGHGRVKAH